MAKRKPPRPTETELAILRVLWHDGPSTVRQFLAADLIDHLHVVLVPIVLGRGVRLWDGLESLEDRFTVESVTTPSGVTHLTFTRR